MVPVFSSGLVSVTFRRFSVDEVIKAATNANLECIEWGGDIHVPHGNTSIAREVAKKTADHGLSVSCYGSYYRLGHSEQKGLSYEIVLESALALGAPVIRIWAGTQSSASLPAGDRARIEKECLRIADLTEKAGCEFTFEYHANTLTDTCASTLSFLKAHDCALSVIWQPNLFLSPGENAADLEKLVPWVSNIHAFHRRDSQRAALADGQKAWELYFDILHKSNKAKYDILLEFVRDDSPDMLNQDARFLRRMAERAAHGNLEQLECS